MVSILPAEAALLRVHPVHPSARKSEVNGDRPLEKPVPVRSTCHVCDLSVDSSAMGELAQQSEPTGCPVKMSDGLPCGRPICQAPSGVNEQPVCLMHSGDPDKDQSQFYKEIHAILNGTSVYLYSKDRYDFTRFVFKEAHFQSAKFSQRVDFSGAKFIGEANFAGAEFHGEAHFTSAIFNERGSFVSTTFHRETFFVGAMFNRDANFLVAKFVKLVHFIGMTCQQDADFIQAKFDAETYFSKTTFSRGAFFTRAVLKKLPFLMRPSLDRSEVPLHVPLGREMYRLSPISGGQSSLSRIKFNFSRSIKMALMGFGLGSQLQYGKGSIRRCELVPREEPDGTTGRTRS